MAVPAAPGVAANDKSATSQDRANGLVTGTINAVMPGKAFGCWGPMNFMAYGSLKRSLTTAAGANSGTVSGVTNIAPGDSVSSTLLPPGTTILTASATTVTFAFPIQTWRCNLVSTSQAVLSFPNGVPSGLTLATLVGAAVSDPNGYFGSGVTVLGVGPDGASLQLSAAPTSVPTLNTAVPIEFAPTANAVLGGTDANATFVGPLTPLGASVLTLNIEKSLDGGAIWVITNIGGSGQIGQFVNPASPINVSFGDPEANALYRVNAIAFSSAVSQTTLNYRWSTTGQAGIVASTPISA